MRNLLTAVVAGFMLATAFAGPASAAAFFDDVPHVNNLALQNQLERDHMGRRLHQGGPGVVISRGDDTPRASNHAPLTAQDYFLKTPLSAG